MRHNKSFNHLGRQSAHRKALLANMATSLVLHKRISTTLAKAKALKVYVEPVITRSKEDTTHSRRIAFSYLKDKKATAELFREIAPKVAGRPGGYTRILKTGFRLGDAADMCIIELVDFNESYNSAAGAAAKAKTRRGRGGKAGETKTAAPAATLTGAGAAGTKAAGAKGAAATATDKAAAPKAVAKTEATKAASAAKETKVEGVKVAEVVEEALPAAEAQPEIEAAPAAE